VRSMLVIRGLMLGLSATLAIVLILRGNVVIGGLIGALAATRAVMFVTMTRRRRAFRQRIRRRMGNRL